LRYLAQSSTDVHCCAAHKQAELFAAGYTVFSDASTPQVRLHSPSDASLDVVAQPDHDALDRDGEVYLDVYFPCAVFGRSSLSLSIDDQDLRR
jgi:hypothetical protein